jgi:RNA polymerase sigma-70 factor (sigma-E family)
MGRGDERMAALYDAHAPDAYRLAYLLTGDREVATDIVQDAFVRLFAHFRELREPAAFPWYLRRTVVNLSRDRYRKLRSERKRDVRLQSLKRGETADPADVESRIIITQALRALPHRQRAALVLRYYEDLSERQTAEVLRCSVPAVKALVARGADALREALRGAAWT